jgi:DNA polymerase-4
VRERVGLPVSVGVARTKFLAKVASALAKPDGLLHVPPAEERAFLHPLPVERMWGVGSATAAKLRGRGIETVGELARAAPAALEAMLGPAAGGHLHLLANGLDPRPLRTRRRRGSVGSQHARGRAPASAADVDADLIALVERVTRRLRAGDRVARSVTLRLRFDDFVRATRSRRLPHPTARTDVVLATARGLLAAAAPIVEERGLTLIGVAVADLVDAVPIQLQLPFDPHDRALLDEALDEIRARFGPGAVGRAVLLGRRAHLEMPVLPDEAAP